MDLLRHHVLLVLMPVFFLSTGLRTPGRGRRAVFVPRPALLVAAWPASCSACGLAGRLLGWRAAKPGHRLAAADQGADHDHLRQRAARQSRSSAADTFTALLLMAVASTMITVPWASPCGQGLHIHPGLAGGSGAGPQAPLSPVVA
jgi:Kef-type K+ transport system membrane component KefB